MTNKEANTSGAGKWKEAKAAREKAAKKAARAAKAADKAAETAKKCIARCTTKASNLAAVSAGINEFDCKNDVAMRNYSNFLPFCVSKKCKKQMDTYERKHEDWKKLLGSSK